MVIRLEAQAALTPAGSPVGERVEGRIEFRGPSVTSGYFRSPTATHAVPVTPLPRSA